MHLKAGFNLEMKHTPLLALIISLFHNFNIFPIEPSGFINSSKVSHILEDFEKKDFSEKNLLLRGQSFSRPEIMMSSSFVSPDLNSDRSLLLRFPNESVMLPVEILFSEPAQFEDYVTEITLHIYSNGSGGELFLLMEDNRFMLHSLPAARLNFSGWKKIRIGIPPEIRQNNILLNKNSDLKLAGFQFNPAKTDSTMKEILIGIDDILYASIPKKKLHPFTPVGK
ncbi:MAG TPA: flagellar filament outer layer protein FlaA [Leptospiraceae bacterium]|nr:flagellar filament outer layer protein FlaA [Leptospiraceae bacterium]